MNYYLGKFLGETSCYIIGKNLEEYDKRLALLKNIFDDYKFTELLLSWNMFTLPDSTLYFFAKTIFNIPWIKQSSIILFFNKKDILKEKIKYFKFKNTFPDFVSDDTDLFETIEFIIQYQPSGAGGTR